VSIRLSIRERIKDHTGTHSSNIAFSTLLALVCLHPTSASSQVHQIVPAKLPQNAAVQHVYNDLLPIDQYARTYEAIWRYPVPKRDMVTHFTQALHTLQKAQQQDPDNAELRLFTGLVAHLSYNLGIDEAYDAALELLQPTTKEDFRTSWFYGIHQCQAVDPVVGMQQFLKVEASTPTLPGAFWQDYANCATTTNMPIHAIRAYDTAKKTADAPPLDEQTEQSARKRSKPGDPAASYPAKLVWSSDQVPGATHYTSNVCGVSFTIRQNSHVTPSDVAKGTCTVSIDTEPYPSRYGPSSGSILMITQTARPNETFEAFTQRILDAFSKGILKDSRSASPTVLTGVQCPVATCVSYEIISNKQYQAEGGAHLLAVFFQSEQPAYPGLKFETPQPRPSPQAFFRPEDVPQRFPGTLYHFIALDANQDIYTRSRADFDQFLKSLAVDSK
jgi:hypothetical protein